MEVLGTIYVHGPQSSRQTGILAFQRGEMWRFGFAGRAEYCYPAERTQDPYHVAEVLEGMQRYLPLGFVGDYHVFCLDMNLGSESPSGLSLDSIAYDGERFPGWLAISGKLSAPAWDVVSHEMAHEVDKTLLTAEDRAVLHGILGIPDLGNDYERTPWYERSQEVIAEYLTLILFRQPLHPDMHRAWGYPSWEVSEKVKVWAKKRFAGMPAADITVLPDVNVLEVHATTGAGHINGEPYVWKQPPVNQGGRLLFWGREWANLLGLGVEYDEVTMMARYTAPQR